MKATPVLTSLLLALTVPPGIAHAQSPPNTPAISSPISGQVVNPFSVHMEAGPFSDPNLGDTHLCTDWEIWTLSPLERVWVTSCITGVERTHTHLGDGVYENSHAGRTSLFYTTSYKVRVRFRDNTGLWSGFAERPFSTGAQTQIYPLITNDVGGGATWLNEFGSPIILQAAATQPFLRLDSASGEVLLQFTGDQGVTNVVTNPSALPGDVALRVTIDGGSSGLTLPQSRLAFTDALGGIHTVYLPSAGLAPSSRIYFWVTSDGSTYAGTGVQTTPDFTTIARGSPVPWTVLRPGFEVELVATGFQLPVSITFAPNPGPDPTDPLFYVSELYGTIKVVSRNLAVSTYATNLLNFDPTGLFPGSGEQGVSGIVVDPVSGDLFAGMLYDSAPPNGQHYAKVVRFHSTDGGRTAATQTTILAMPGETQGQSHFISDFSIGPDGKLYVHMGDGFNDVVPLDLNFFRGKILRMNLDGSAPSDNPFYNAGDGINARDYVYAYGFRNPFGGGWRAADGRHYEVENGNAINDRFARVMPGVSYGWDGTNESMTVNAIHVWVQTVCPVDIAFVEPQTFGGSNFPTSLQDHAFVTLSGTTYGLGPEDRKGIDDFYVSTSGTLVSGPTPLIRYSGMGHATAAGIAAGPDGLYFTDLYKDLDATSPIDPGANVLRIKYRGVADFSSSVQKGTAPLTVTFSDLSDVPSPSGWLWEFGDGTTSTQQNPIHTYIHSGMFTVRLTVTGASGQVLAEKISHIVVGPMTSGLLGNYYLGMTLSELRFARIDPTIDFNWGGGSPSPSLPIDQISTRWTGEIQPQFTETYRFFTTTDDGVRLRVNNQLVIDKWTNQPPTEWWGDIQLTAGQWYPITMEYFEDGGGAEAHLSWESASQIKQIVPAARLRTQDPVTAVDPEPAPAVSRVTLFPSVPNPFRTNARLAFALPQTGPATLRVYNVQGSLVKTLFDGVAQAQRVYELPFGAGDLAAGVYFEHLEAAGVRVTRKLVVLR